MRELMLKLLTYEPFVKINGDEKRYIKAVLKDRAYDKKKCEIYESLMLAFKEYTESKDRDKCVALVEWFNACYDIGKSESGKIGVRCNKLTGERTYYPALFKKICYFCLVEYFLPDAEFLSQFELKENIIKKWGVSARYGKTANRNTHKKINVSRNGKK